MPVSSVGIGMVEGAAIRDVPQAADALEAMLFRQLLQSMTQAAGSGGLLGGGFEGGMYQDMFASIMAQDAAQGPSPLSRMIARSLGYSDDTPPQGLRALRAVTGAMTYRSGRLDVAEPPSNGVLAQVAVSLAGGGDAGRWGVSGALTAADLAAPVATAVDGGTAVFNVRDANGYQGYPKCNLFALELLRRAGFAVPMVARAHGWGYPSAAAVAASNGVGRAPFAAVRTAATAEELDALAQRGQPLLLAAGGADGDPGHMAVADRIHRIERAEDGRILALEYSGWEAGPRGAGYGRRVWRAAGVRGPGRGDLHDIQVLAPLRGDGVPVPLDARLPGPSVWDGQGEETSVQLAQAAGGESDFGR